MKNIYKFLIIVFVVAVVVPQITLASWWNPVSWGLWGKIWGMFNKQQNTSVVCTQDAKLCPDGTSVGREGPKCEFKACPSNNNYFEIKELGIKFKITGALKDLTYNFATLSDGTKSVAFTTTSLLAADKDCIAGSIGNLQAYIGTPPAESWFSYQTPIISQGDTKFYYIHPQAVCANSQNNKKAIDLQGSQTDALQAAIKTIQLIQPIVGGDRDSHGCIGSAGYSWCEAKQKCLRQWEEKCEAVLSAKEKACKDNEGIVVNQDCYCSGTQDFYSTCAVGGCTCTPDPKYKREIKRCECGVDRCWNGSMCISTMPPPPASN